MYGSRNPAGVAAGQLGLITTGLAMGVVGCHERGIAAMRAARERRAENDTVVALHILNATSSNCPPWRAKRWTRLPG